MCSTAMLNPTCNLEIMPKWPFEVDLSELSSCSLYSFMESNQLDGTVIEKRSHRVLVFTILRVFACI